MPVGRHQPAQQVVQRHQRGILALRLDQRVDLADGGHHGGAQGGMARGQRGIGRRGAPAQSGFNVPQGAVDPGPNGVIVGFIDRMRHHGTR